MRKHYGFWLLLILLGSVCNPVIAQLRVPVFGQRWEPWQRDQLGTGSTTIGSHGCAVSCVAMVQSYWLRWGTPRDLNNWLKSHGGYADGDLIIWGRAAGYSGRMRYSGSSGADLNRINNHLSSGYPVVAEVRLSGRMHFVVITGRSNGTYFINDPWNGDRTTLNARYGNPINAIRKAHYYWWSW